MFVEKSSYGMKRTNVKSLSEKIKTFVLSFSRQLKTNYNR